MKLLTILTVAVFLVASRHPVLLAADVREVVAFKILTRLLQVPNIAVAVL